jgi:ABC-type sugar transport system permease subunit
MPMREKLPSLASTRRREVNRVALLFMLPAFFFIAVFIAYPIADSMYLSLFKWDGFATVAPSYIGFSNWRKLLTDTVFWHAALNNLKIVGLSIAIQLPVGIGLGYLLDSTGRKLNILKVMWFIPYLLSSVAIGLLFRYAYDPYFGIVKYIAPLFGKTTIDLLGDPGRALYAVIAVICWQFTPFYMVYFLAGLSSMDTDIYEAALIDGATRGQFFFKIVLPILSPTIRNACILSLVGSLKYFDLIYVMTGGGPNLSINGVTTGATELMATYMYKNAFTTNEMGYGSAIAMGMFLIVTSVSAITMRMMSGKERA